MGDVGEWGFVFDSLVGLAAWWGSIKQRQSLSSAPLSLCPVLSDWRRRRRGQREQREGHRGDRPTTRLSASEDYQTASGVAGAQTDWLGVGCCSFFITAWLDVIYGLGWENFGGPWLYFVSMVCWTLCGFAYIADSLGGTSLAEVTCALRPLPPTSRALVSFALVLLLHKSSVYNGHHVNTVHAVLPADSRPGSKRGVQHREKPVARRTVSPRRWER